MSDFIKLMVAINPKPQLQKYTAEFLRPKQNQYILELQI